MKIKLITIIIIQILLTNLGNAQTNEFYSIQKALQEREKVESLFINYNFQEIKDLPNCFDQFVNLKELILFPRLFQFPKIEGNQLISNTIDSSKNRTIERLPKNIIACKKLRKINLSLSSIRELPIGFGELKNLEVLILNGSEITLDNEIEKLLQLYALKRLEILECKISEKNFNRLKTKNPKLKIYKTIEDFEKIEPLENPPELQIHDTYIVFKNEEEFNQFMNSAPKEFENLVTRIDNKN